MGSFSCCREIRDNEGLDLVIGTDFSKVLRILKNVVSTEVGELGSGWKESWVPLKKSVSSRRQQRGSASFHSSQGAPVTCPSGEEPALGVPERRGTTGSVCWRRWERLPTRRESVLQGVKTLPTLKLGAAGENGGRGEYLGVPRMGEGLLAGNSHCLLRNMCRGRWLWAVGEGKRRHKGTLGDKKFRGEGCGGAAPESERG